jgi:hypothetical protein
MSMLWESSKFINDMNGIDPLFVNCFYFLMDLNNSTIPNASWIDHTAIVEILFQ